MKKTEKGKRETVWVSTDLNKNIEDLRSKLGLSKSGIFKFAIVELIKQYQTKQIQTKGE